jgi:hypothetical protein
MQLKLGVGFGRPLLNRKTASFVLLLASNFGIWSSFLQTAA